MSNKIENKTLSFTNLTKKFWKDQLFSYFIATLSCYLSFLIEGDIKAILYSHKQQKKLASSFLRNTVNGDEIIQWNFLLNISIVIFFYFVVVFVHVWYLFYIQNKIRSYIKKLISQKVFESKDYAIKDKNLVMSLLNNNVRDFSEYVFFIPNQLWYIFCDVILKGILLKNIRGDNPSSWKFFIQYFVFLIFVCFILQFSFYIRELIVQESLKDESKSEFFLTENRNLIIKKNLVSENLNNYDKVLAKSFWNFNKRDMAQSMSFVFPSYFLIKWFPFVSLFLVGYSHNNLQQIIATIIIYVEILDNFRKFIERSKNYPFYFSSQKKLNIFLMKEDRNEVQKNVEINEKVNSISFKNVSFSYEKNKKKILDNLNITFKSGQINVMNFPNGFGKSTIISLLFGLISVQEGDIIVNNKYKLRDFDLIRWREKIAYSEHKNLIIEEDLSTGQKQFTDLENSLNDLKKDIYIFDEADSNLDLMNRHFFIRKISEISKNKIVILVTHTTSIIEDEVN